MSENPNPTTCGNCGTLNPPGHDCCVACRAPLTASADASVLDGAPEAIDDPTRYDPGETREVVVLGGIVGAPIPVPEESVSVDPDRAARD